MIAHHEISGATARPHGPENGVLDQVTLSRDDRAKDNQAAIPPQPNQPATPRKNKRARQFWLKQLHGWHWVSAAMSLVGMFLFAITGITLNHASSIGAEPQVVTREAVLPAPLLARLATANDAAAPLPPSVAQGVRDLVGVETHDLPAEWSADEVYIAVPGPGTDAWVSIDRATGAVMSEQTDRGFVSFVNDLHKGRNTGTAWFWFIDVLSVACVIFTFTGLLLLQLHARHRPTTWPLVGIGTAIPLVIILFFLHI